MKFRATFTIEVDADDWSMAYGVQDPEAIKADVLSSLTTQGDLGASDAPIKLTVDDTAKGRKAVAREIRPGV